MVKGFLNSILIILCLMACVFSMQAQDKTISSGNKPTGKEAVSKHKIMIIPFENRMYLSEIDFMINKESFRLVTYYKSVNF